MKLTELIKNRIAVFDGAMGTQIQKKGIRQGELPETWNLTHPDDILDIHRAYVSAGCDILKTNTFGANPIKYAGTEYDCTELIKAAISIARKAADECADRKVFVAASFGSLGKLLKPLGELDFEDAVSAFRTAIEAASEADFILFETFGDIYEMKAALLAAKEADVLPYAITAMLDESGRLLTGGDAQAFCALAESLGAFAVGLNCGLGPKQMRKILPSLAKATSLPLIVNSNAGLPRVENGVTVFDVTPEEFALDVTGLVNDGAVMVGGCCGTSPEYIEKVAKAVCNIAPVCRNVKEHTVVSSYTHAVNIDEKPVMIGERVNPTGKPKLKKALADGDLEYVCREAIAQADKAQILDINAGLPGIDEADMLTKMVTSVQAVCDLPLQIDTGNPEAMERAVRRYNGKPLINSVNGKQSSMDAIFPIAKKYGAALVCLCLDENGIPETAEGRFEIAKKLVTEAAKYGIEKKNLLIDSLVMTVSTGADNALVTLETMKRIKNELGVCTVLGVSNVSFGLPERTRINSTFYTMALANGLNAGIVNPLDENMLSAYRSFCALSAYDKLGLEYINSYSGAVNTQTKQEKEISLSEAIKKGLAEDSASAAEKLLGEGKTALEIIDGELVPALDEVGVGFENKTVFLPQLLMSAEAAKSAFSVIRGKITSDGSAESKGKIVIATVEGDIHDIGKNIVRALLENYGFEVIDLGKDVKCETVVAKAKELDVKMVALSALMTTTVPSMEKTIKLLKEQLPDCRTLVGGAVLTQDYADRIGADYYAKDAMASVRIALDYFGG